MSTKKQKKKYSCFNDCKMSGCPSHEMSVSIQTVSDSLLVERDGEVWFGADPEEWRTLLSVLDELSYYNFPTNHL